LFGNDAFFGTITEYHTNKLCFVSPNANAASSSLQCNGGDGWAKKAYRLQNMLAHQQTKNSRPSM